MTHAVIIVCCALENGLGWFVAEFFWTDCKYIYPAQDWNIRDAGEETFVRLQAMFE